MTTATLTSKGQITIPSEVRRALNVQSGDRVEFVQIEPGRYEIVPATRSVRELKGLFGKAPRVVSIAEMNRAIAEQGAGAAPAPEAGEVIGLDTNVLVRYVMQDDPRQAARAARLIDSLSAEEPGFVPLVAIVELVWVLAGSYGLSRAQVAQVLETLLRSKELVVDRAELVAQALTRYSAGGADFADALIERIAAAAGCTMTMTFDAGAVKAAAMSPVP